MENFPIILITAFWTIFMFCGAIIAWFGKEAVLDFKRRLSIIDAKLDALPDTYVGINICDKKILNCHKNNNDLIKARKETTDTVFSEVKTSIDNLTKVQGEMIDSFDNLAGCISKYTKGACP